MGRSLVEGARCEGVRKRVYLPDVDEFRSSSGPLSEVVLESLDTVSSPKAKPLKEGYVADITREGGVSPSCVILGLLYIHRLTETNPRFLRSLSSKDLFLTAMVVASKYLNDEGECEALTNSEWAEVGCKAKPALDLLERQFLAAIDWRLYVSLDEYYSFVTGIEGRIALNQFASRGWLSYTDLVTIWDTMDTQTALLTATKQVTKVTCGSAAVYLVLLSTLFTASHTLNSSWGPSSPSPSSSFPLSSPSAPDTANTTSTDIVSLMMQDPPNVPPLELPLKTYGESPPDLSFVLRDTRLQHSRLKILNSLDFEAPIMPSVPLPLCSPPLCPNAAQCVHYRYETTGPGFDFDFDTGPNSRNAAFSHRDSGCLCQGLWNSDDHVKDCSGYCNTRTLHCRCGSESVAADENVTSSFPCLLRGVDSASLLKQHPGFSRTKATKHFLQPPHCPLPLHHTTSDHSGNDSSGTLLSTVYQFLGEIHGWATSGLLQVVVPHQMLRVSAAHKSNFSLDSSAITDHRWLAVDDRLKGLLVSHQGNKSYSEMLYTAAAGIDGGQLLLPVLDEGSLWL